MSGTLLDGFQLLEQIFYVRQSAGVDLLVAHDSLLVHDERGASGQARLFIVDAPFRGDLALGVVVGQDGVGDAAQAHAEHALGEPAVRAGAQDLSAFLLEPLDGAVQRGDLVGSAASEGGGVPGEDDVFLTLELAEGDALAVLVGDAELRSDAPYFNCHDDLPYT